MAADAEGAKYDTCGADELAAMLGVPSVYVFESIGSTMDEAHRLAAAGAASGTLVLADQQTQGRGRSGKRWSSPARGIWMTIIERPSDAPALEVLSLRVGLAAARALDPFVAEPVRLKWPNDLFVDDGKLAGTLVEARWRGESPDWVAIGLGVNVSVPADHPAAASLEPGTSRIDALVALVPEVREAARAAGSLSAAELDEYAGRDLARGRECSEPVRGKVVGVAPSGELIVELADATTRVRSGSLVLL